MFVKYNMTDIIRIPNIENYTWEIINGELVLTPKTQVTDKVNSQTTVTSTPISVPKLGTRLTRTYDTSWCHVPLREE
jgi:hypothetical protein